MAARRSQFVDTTATEAPGLYYQDPRYIYHVPQTSLRNMAPAPIRMTEDYYNQTYPLPATPPTPYIFNACCRGRSRSRRRRASRPSNTYDSDGSTDGYPSYGDAQPTQQGVDRLPPRIALKQLSDFLYAAAIFYDKQLNEFAHKHYNSGYTSNKALRQLLWKDWMGRRDDVTLESFTSTKINTTTLFRQVEAAAEMPWLEDPDIEARFNSTLKILQGMCFEIIRLAGKATSDWQACRFLADELNNARSYASPEGPVQRHLFSGWDKPESW
ncbi:hypothetical protein FVEN_g11628 [Fusarium venenatum]|uniref:Uncharacterized protein n=2 Tax=Fusarium venenatum TaxID=56646 RepID=A0A2L2T1X5_9HYPO|nr:uncharacterized protein FVRRES_01116 [Fusarium venenatum]KAG8350187.1 hypothetical protein FVEN_g11628 [Fusarium venenatum]CEI64604.1 unnamed protein product [Fusarium venenatum]